MENRSMSDNKGIEMAELTRSVNRVAKSIADFNAAPGHDETGGTVDSLTEAVMGITAGLCRIADAIESLAQAVSTAREKA
jgi:hypothetical protein